MPRKRPALVRAAGRRAGRRTGGILLSMGRIVVSLEVSNAADLLSDRPRRAVRRARLRNVLVDTGASRLHLQERVIGRLGLRPVHEVLGRTSNGDDLRTLYEPVRLTCQGRSAFVEVVGIPDTVPNLLGQIPLESLDLVVDPRGARLTGNPDHKGVDLIDEF